ncbi:MAG: tellurite resistance/C4-dicarboxylate transporter family protein [Nocardioidaceae bacterium]
MPAHVLSRAQTAVRELSPGYFALVMATGIVSTGLDLIDQRVLSDLFLWVAGVAFVLLAFLSGWRVVRYRDRLAQDFLNLRRDFGFLTFVAGTNVLAARLALAGQVLLATVLLIGAGVSWLILGYVVPWAAFLSRGERPPLAEANGSWFMWVVSSQSVAVAAASLEMHTAGAHSTLQVLSVLTWSIGVFLYGVAGIFVALRMVLYEFHAEALDPTYWITMGAASITVLAGAGIVDMSSAPLVDDVRGLVKALSVMFWALATWLIPLLLAAFWWRHVAHRVRLAYEPAYWSVAFPLGMYAVASIYLGRADQLELVADIGRVELWVAVAFAALLLVAMVEHVVRTVLLEGPAEGEPPPEPA